MDSLRNQMSNMKEELDDLQRDRLELLSGVSAAIDEPLEGILDEVEALSRPGGRNTAGVEESLARLKAAAAKITRQREILTEIDLMRATSLNAENEENLPQGWNEEIALDDLLAEAIQSCSDSLGEKRLNLTVAMDEQVLVRGSRDYLSKALRAMLYRTVTLAPLDSIVSLTMERKPPSAELRITYRGAARGGGDRMELSEELARQVMLIHGGWLRRGGKQGEYQAGLPLD